MGAHWRGCEYYLIRYATSSQNKGFWEKSNRNTSMHHLLFTLLLLPWSYSYCFFVLRLTLVRLSSGLDSPPALPLTMFNVLKCLRQQWLVVQTILFADVIHFGITSSTEISCTVTTIATYDVAINLDGDIFPLWLYMQLEEDHTFTGRFRSEICNVSMFQQHFKNLLAA